MTDAKPKYANFPTNDLKVIIGANINAATTKTLTRMSIGTYEMSFTQIEKGKLTASAVRSAFNVMSKAQGLTLSSEASRDFVGVFTAINAEFHFQAWITTPFELTQAGHVIWILYKELAGENKVGISFKLATAFSIDDVVALVKTAQKNSVVLGEGDAYTLKGNPAPRFQKKEVLAAVTTTSETPAETEASSAEV